MKVLKYLFGIFGGSAVLVAFFLPWINAPFAPVGVSGRDLALGYGSDPIQLAQSISTSAAVALTRGDGWLWVVFGCGILALLAILFSLGMRLEKASIVTAVALIISSLVGFAFLYLRAADFLEHIDSTSTVLFAARDFFQGVTPTLDGQGQLSVGIGLYLLLAGLFLNMLGGLFSFVPQTSHTHLPVAEMSVQEKYPGPAMTPSPFPVQNVILPTLTGPETVLDGPKTIADEPLVQPVYTEAKKEEKREEKREETGHVDRLPVKNMHPDTLVDAERSPATELFDVVQPDPEQAFAWLIVRQVTGLTTGQSFTISANRFTIGRGAENMLTLTDSSVSTQHAEIQQSHGRFLLHDLGSSNGTFIFDRAKNDWVQVSQFQLKDGDQIRFGRSTFSFVNVKD